MTSRLEYALEYIAKKHLNELKEAMGDSLEDDLSIQEVGIIEESLIESKVIAESCLSSCEECNKYLTHDCVKNMLCDNDSDAWCKCTLSIDEDGKAWSTDDYLEMKRQENK